ncbi:MAG: VanZ family protein [Planctomycetes bacterium]|nr:VanZ family protein [Planctomycetota bacterium]
MRWPLRPWLTVVGGIYWLAMFIATHIPKVPQELVMPGGDKGMHFTAYAVLALILTTRQFWGAHWKWRTAAQIIVVVAVYGIVDELTQIPVGRHADVWDWLADVSGALFGLATAAGLRLLGPGRLQKNPGPTVPR